jgi:3-phenylpropionate/trans-cinnamate dioxygenase ferredoxin reductase component
MTTDRPGGRKRTFLVVGANVAGGRAAEALRAGGFEGRLILIGAEPERPYERPPLSKGYLSGQATDEKLFLRPAGYYAEQAIELRLGTRATGLDAETRVVELSDGERLGYDALLIATGAYPRKLAVRGADLDGVLYLRDLRDARALRGQLATCQRVVIVGAGFIGAEIAASVRTYYPGREVVMLEALPVPLERALGPLVGGLYAEVHRAHGVDLRTGEGVSGFARTSDGEYQVITASGTRIGCDLIVVGVGVAPEVGWLERSAIELRNGVVVDELCRTSLPDVYAAGDVANWWHPRLGHHVRVEHFDNAQHQGVAAARSMLGQGQPYAPVNYFWSDQYDLSLQYVGHARGDDEVILRGDVGSVSWSAFYVRDGVLKAALAVNRFRDVSAARQLIARAIPVSPDQLRDEDVDLKVLARSAGSLPIT